MLDRKRMKRERRRNRKRAKVNLRRRTGKTQVGRRCMKTKTPLRLSANILRKVSKNKELKLILEIKQNLEKMWRTGQKMKRGR